MASKEFDEWLCDKIKFLQLDEDIFLDYLKGVLEEDVSAEEKEETISNILQGATVRYISSVIMPIYKSSEHGSSRQDLLCAKVNRNVCRCARVLKRSAMCAHYSFQ